MVALQSYGRRDADDGAGVNGLRDLPVSVELPGVLGQEVTAFVEVEAGWQVVSAGGSLAPVLALAAAPVPGRASVVVVPGPVGSAVVREALLSGALDVIGWPQDRARLLEAPLRAARGGPSASAGRGAGRFAVGGLAGGAGTSTVALGVAAVLAWSGRRTVVVGDSDLLVLCGMGPWRGPGSAELAALGPDGAAAELPGLVRPVPGVDGLSVLGGGPVSSTAGWPADVAVVDLGVVGRGSAVVGADLLVARPDSCLAAAGAAPADAAVLVVGEGPLDRTAVRRVLGRAPDGWLPRCARVARAGVAGRLPSGMPGSYLAALRDVLRRVHR